MDFEKQMKAMVLCAGFGTRLGDITREIPKPMLPLQGRPMLEYLLAHLRTHGFGQVAINLHFKPRVIRDHFGNGSAHKLELVYSDEPSLLGTAGGVKKMESFLRHGGPFLVQYGDVVTDQDFSAMLKFHREQNALVTLLVHQRLKSNSVVSLDGDGRVIGFLERPDEKAREGVVSPWVNSGVCIAEPGFLESIPDGLACDLPRDIFPKLIGTGRLFGFPMTGYRCAVDSPQRLEEVRTAIAEGRCRIRLD
jgi:mannose-1-phosphate guanylyltransferase/phosphomannomutase